MPEEKTFFVRGEDGEEYGPVGLAELRQWVAENRAGLGTTVRLGAPGELWQPWQYHPELVALLADVRVTGSGVDGASPIVAPLGRRSVAAVTDLILCYLVTAPILAVVFFLPPEDLSARLYVYYWSVLQGAAATAAVPEIPLWFAALSNLVYYGIPVLYFGGFVAAHSRTPAKSIFRLRVVDAQGRKPVFLKAFLRGLIFVASVYVFYGIPLLYAFLNPQRRALHDIVASTYVVER
jgi:uncharacterized RDD family membrane protein YckC